MILNMLGRIIMLEGILLVLPLITSLCYGEKSGVYILITIGIALASGLLMTLISKPRQREIYAKDGFVIVALAWLALSVIGALPFYLSREIPSFIDSFFETVSGFTTTGASILTKVENMSYGLLFWRSFTHWIGGMGILVMIMAIIPSDSGRSMHIMRAEMPGPVVDKILPRVRDTAKILYFIYLGMTLLETVLLLFGGMSFFESLVHSFGTAGTGGFGVRSSSIGEYSPYIQWVITAFMLMFGINFNLYYLILIGKFRSAFKSRELWVYLSVITVSAAIIAINTYSLFDSLSDTVRASAFQVSAIITTTGYSTVDFNLWPTLSKTIIFLLTFMGGCAGSTGGGLKVSRVILLFKIIRANMRKMLHPRSVRAVQFEGRPVDEATLHGVTNYFAVYMVFFAAIVLILSLETNPSLDLGTNITATTACFNNIGPGFGAVGPAGNFSLYSGLSKIVLSFGMLLGRLEIYPILLCFSPSTWRNK